MSQKHLTALGEFLNLSEDSIPDWAVVVMDYINPEGKSRVKYAVLGKPTLEQIIAKLELVKFEAWHRTGEDKE